MLIKMHPFLQVTVFFVDYGNERVVEKEELKGILPHMMEAPFQVT